MDITKNCVVQNPQTGRVFLVVEDPGRLPQSVRLKRLDRQQRELSEICRPLKEIQGWRVIFRPLDLEPFKAVIQKAMDAYSACVDGAPLSGLAVPMQDLAELVED